MFRLVNVSTNDYRETETKPVLMNGVWECGGFRVVDKYGDQYTVENIPEPLKIDPITFKLCFTSAERIKAKELRATDAAIEDFWTILDDPRTAIVDMTLPSIQGAIEHTLTEINANGVTIDVAARKAEILAGQFATG